MTRVPGTDLFTCSTRLEPDAAINYGFVVDYGEPSPDPLNPRPGSGLFGDVSFVPWATLFAFDAEPPAAGEHPLVVYQRWGPYHLRAPHENFDSARANFELRDQLRERGHRPGGSEVSEVFGWNLWRGYVGEMLRVLFPEPVS